VSPTYFFPFIPEARLSFPAGPFQLILGKWLCLTLQGDKNIRKQLIRCIEFGEGRDGVTLDTHVLKNNRGIFALGLHKVG
jgi:hypothetical protein